jgi:formylglycine-generating enzyme required for sulfatase activity
VGAFKPNAFGLHDMLGNVSEWVEDCYNKSYEGAPTDGRAWTTTECSRRVIRGGNWSHSSAGVRTGNRNGDPPSLQNMIVGFRVARTLP